DRYQPGETALISFIHLTEYPFGIRKIRFYGKGNFLGKTVYENKNCSLIQSRREGRDLKGIIPENFSGPAFFEATFCQHPEKMPPKVTSNRIEIF
ncbi:MAG: hypothetical protein Q7S00_06130, partial [bacterium]|nr:hypothetical protein [bacterium]